MNTGAKGDWAAVVVPNLLSMVNAGADQHEALATAMFRPTPFEAGFREILACHAPHNALLSVGDLVDGPLWVAGGAETEVTLEIEHDSQRVLWPFTLRRVRDERAYIGSSGLVLRITDTREMPEGERVHELSWSVAEEGSADLPTSGQLDFLRILVPGARLNEAGRPLIPVEHFGVQGIGRSIAAIELTFSRLGLSGFQPTAVAGLRRRRHGAELGVRGQECVVARSRQAVNWAQQHAIRAFCAIAYGLHRALRVRSV